MAYNAWKQGLKNVIYSGDATYDCRLYFNDILVPPEQISNIKISSPIIDTTSDTGKMFHIGTFISQQIKIKFRNLDGLDLTSNPDIYLEIGVEVDGEFVYIPIGHYLIDELAENYQKTCEITCLDYAIKFKPNLDITQFLNEDKYILASDLFEAICRYFGVEVGTYPTTNNDKKIYFYDNTLSGKNYISFLAELFGGNAKIGRDGKCYITQLYNPLASPIEIDAMSSKSFQVGDVYEISRVCYDNGKLKFQAGGDVITVDTLPETDIDISAYYYLTKDLKYYTYVNEGWSEATDIKNTLYIRQENLFITQQEEIDNIYNAVVGFKIHNITCENRGDITLDAWDVLTYVTDNGTYQTLNENELTYNGVCMSKVKTNIPAGKKNETTNIINSSIDAAIKRVQTIVNEAEASVTTLTEKTTKLETKTLENETNINNNYQNIINQLGDYAKEAEVISIKESVSTIQNEASLAVEIAKKVQTDGVDQITTKTGYTFNEDGLTIQKTGSKVKSTLDEAGLEIIDATGATNESLLFAGYDEKIGETIVETKNLTVNKYLVIGKYSRMEDFVKDGVAGTGMFWVRSDRRSKYMYRIYKLTFPSGKIYIGITSRTIKERIYSGYDNKFIKKEISNCGWESVKKEELYQIENEEDAFQKEIDMIKFYDSTNPEIGYNQSTGGQAPHKGSKMSPKNKEQLIERLKNNKYHLNQKHTEETKRKISELHKGKHHSRETEFPTRRVICIQTGEIFESLNMAERVTGVNHSKISMVCQGKRKSANGFTWKYVVEEVG